MADLVVYIEAVAVRPGFDRDLSIPTVALAWVAVGASSRHLEVDQDPLSMVIGAAAPSIVVATIVPAGRLGRRRPLQAVPGVGPVVAATIRAWFGPATQFPSAKEVAEVTPLNLSREDRPPPTPESC